MKIQKAIRLLPLLLLLSGAALAADEYKIDPVHSSANFSVKHMLISTVHGRFTGLSGTILYDEKDPKKSSVEAVIKTASITTDNEYRDKDLRGADFFEVDKYPEITFKSKRVEKRGKQLVAIGMLTMKNVSKEIELPFEINKVTSPWGVVIGATATTQLNRQDYGITYSKKLDGGGLVVSDDVKIELDIEAKPQAPAKPAAATKN